MIGPLSPCEGVIRRAFKLLLYQSSGSHAFAIDGAILKWGQVDTLLNDWPSTSACQYVQQSMQLSIPGIPSGWNRWWRVHVSHHGAVTQNFVHRDAALNPASALIEFHLNYCPRIANCKLVV
ncbi:conserved hypothetical protein [Trichinella spiralis]|uniref:hypothetical protein n=1 Tax=Trichinella spiralis TaxID=6334 RepID=UPI0001EFB7E0|nr:conserved hypothetical protein [Trichinella spiralis]